MAVPAHITTKVLRTVRTFAGPLRDHASTRTTPPANHVVMPYINHAEDVVTQGTLVVVGVGIFVDGVDVVLI